MARTTNAARKAAPQATQITEQVSVGGVPPAPNGGAPGSAARVSTLRAQPTQEYVSAGGNLALANYAKALPQAIDDLSAELGSSIYQQMMLDPQVSSMINVLRSSVLEDGMLFAPAVTAEDDPKHKAAVTMAEWVTKVFKRIKPSLDEVLWDLCSAFALGNRVAELIWEVAPDPDTGRPALLLKAIKTKPAESTGFVVDSYNNLLGLLAVEVGRAFPVQQNLYVTDLDKIPNLLPREKFVVLTFRSENDDPRGTTPLRQAYDAWWLAKQARALHLSFLAQAAGPSVIGFTPEGAESLTVDTNGDPLPINSIVSPEMAMATQLATIKSGTALSFPHGSVVQPLILSGGAGSVFELFDDRQEKRITKAILNQLLATEEGKHQTRAASGTHKDILDTIVRQIRRVVEGVITDQVVRLLVLWNFGEDALEDAPVPTLGRTEQHDMVGMSAAIAALESSGYLGESQKPGIDNLLGLPVRDEEADAEAAAQALQIATQLAETDPAMKVAGRTASKAAAGDAVSSARAEATRETKGATASTKGAAGAATRAASPGPKGRTQGSAHPATPAPNPGG